MPGQRATFSHVNGGVTFFWLPRWNERGRIADAINSVDQPLQRHEGQPDQDQEAGHSTHEKASLDHVHGSSPPTPWRIVLR
jgi:hypothetical protein